MLTNDPCRPHSMQDCTLWPLLLSEDQPAAPPEEVTAPSFPLCLLITACDFYAEMPR